MLYAARSLAMDARRAVLATLLVASSCALGVDANDEARRLGSSKHHGGDKPRRTAASRRRTPSRVMRAAPRPFFK